MRFALLVSALALLAAGIASLATPDRHAPARQALPPVAREVLRLPVALPERRIEGKARGDPFAARDWTPRAPQAPIHTAQEPVLEPSAPPNPYRFAGTLHDGGGLKAVFIRDEHVHIAHTGDTLDGGYKVVFVTRDGVTLLYRLLDIEKRIVLAFGDPAPDTTAVQAQPPAQANGAASSPFPLGSPLVSR